MTTKDSTLILHVNLECEKCYKKIQKLLCKLQAKEDIRKIDYENTKNRVTISGNFDPVKLSKKLRCKACDAIKDIEIVKPPKEEKKKSEEKKPEEKKKPDEEKKPAAEEKKKGDNKEKEKDQKATTTAASATTVNLQFTNICGICYPWPCSDPAHWGGGLHQQQLPHQWPSLPAPGHRHQHPPSCGGPSVCGGCAWCHGGGGGLNCWQPQAMPMCCPGPKMCRGCNGCKIVRESKFSYEEYPSSACAIM